jgi:hypothetical protein
MQNALTTFREDQGQTPGPDSTIPLVVGDAAVTLGEASTALRTSSLSSAVAKWASPKHEQLTEFCGRPMGSAPFFRSYSRCASWLGVPLALHLGGCQHSFQCLQCKIVRFTGVEFLGSVSCRRHQGGVVLRHNDPKGSQIDCSVR